MIINPTPNPSSEGKGVARQKSHNLGERDYEKTREVELIKVRRSKKTKEFKRKKKAK